MNNIRKTRVIKKDGRFYPQYRTILWFSKRIKWNYYTYEMSYLICSGYAENETLNHVFDSKTEALHYIKSSKL